MKEIWLGTNFALSIVRVGRLRHGRQRPQHWMKSRDVV
jgi:hypothetical protein